MDTHNPHDGLVKHVFSNPEAAEAELRLLLPAALTEQLDWKTLEVEPSSFVDAALRHRASDMLFSIECKGTDSRVLVYVLMEHQSSPDAMMAVRFLVYLARLYERYLRQHVGTKTVPLVVPLLLYQGSSGWTLPRRLSELLDAPVALLEAMPSPVELEFAVDDLEHSTLDADLTRAQLLGTRGLVLAEMARTMLWLHRHPHATDGERAARLSILRDVVEQAFGTEAVRPFFTYFLSVFGLESPVGAIMLQSASAETDQMYTTIRDELLAKGRAEGLVEGAMKGKAEGKAAMLERLLLARGIALTEELRDRVRTCADESLLDRWFDRAIAAATATEVFDD